MFLLLRTIIQCNSLPIPYFLKPLIIFTGVNELNQAPEAIATDVMT